MCGEAKSHCVNFTLRDILADWLLTGRPTSDIYLLLDGMSNLSALHCIVVERYCKYSYSLVYIYVMYVGCSTVYGCDELANTFEHDMRAAGVSCLLSTELKFD